MSHRPQRVTHLDGDGLRALLWPGRRYCQQHILRFQVAMHDAVSAEQLQARHNALGGPPSCPQRKASKTSTSQGLVQIYAKRLKNDARVLPEVEIVQHAYHVTPFISVGPVQHL